MQVFRSKPKASEPVPLQGVDVEAPAVAAVSLSVVETFADRTEEEPCVAGGIEPQVAAEAMCAVEGAILVDAPRVAPVAESDFSWRDPVPQAVVFTTSVGPREVIRFVHESTVMIQSFAVPVDAHLVFNGVAIFWAG